MNLLRRLHPTTIHRTYHGLTQQRAIRAWVRDARRLARDGYVPISVSHHQGFLHHVDSVTYQLRPGR